MALFHSGIAGANVMKFKKYIARTLAPVTNGFVSLVAGLVVIWLFGQSPLLRRLLSCNFPTIYPIILATKSIS